MIIRSQSKTQLINFNNIKSVAVGSENCIYANELGWHTVIGEYSTEEKAIKVLDMITDFYSDIQNNKANYDGYMLNAFKMPQDNEVTV
jgi:hypothetical protein